MKLKKSLATHYQMDVIKNLGFSFDETSKVVKQGTRCRTFGKRSSENVILDSRNAELRGIPMNGERVRRVVSELTSQGRCFHAISPLEETTSEGVEYRIYKSPTGSMTKKSLAQFSDVDTNSLKFQICYLFRELSLKGFSFENFEPEKDMGIFKYDAPRYYCFGTKVVRDIGKYVVYIDISYIKDASTEVFKKNQAAIEKALGIDVNLEDISSLLSETNDTVDQYIPCYREFTGKAPESFVRWMNIATSSRSAPTSESRDIIGKMLEGFYLKCEAELKNVIKDCSLIFDPILNISNIDVTEDDRAMADLLIRKFSLKHHSERLLKKIYDIAIVDSEGDFRFDPEGKLQELQKKQIIDYTKKISVPMSTFVSQTEDVCGLANWISELCVPFVQTVLALRRIGRSLDKPAFEGEVFLHLQQISIFPVWAKSQKEQPVFDRTNIVTLPKNAFNRTLLEVYRSAFTKRALERIEASVKVHEESPRTQTGFCKNTAVQIMRQTKIHIDFVAEWISKEDVAFGKVIEGIKKTFVKYEKGAKEPEPTSTDFGSERWIQECSPDPIQVSQVIYPDEWWNRSAFTIIAVSASIVYNQTFSVYFTFGDVISKVAGGLQTSGNFEDIKTEGIKIPGFLIRDYSLASVNIWGSLFTAIWTFLSNPKVVAKGAGSLAFRGGRQLASAIDYLSEPVTPTQSRYQASMDRARKDNQRASVAFEKAAAANFESLQLPSEDVETSPEYETYVDISIPGSNLYAHVEDALRLVRVGTAQSDSHITKIQPEGTISDVKTSFGSSVANILPRVIRDGEVSILCRIIWEDPAHYEKAVTLSNAIKDIRLFGMKVSCPVVQLKADGDLRDLIGGIVIQSKKNGTPRFVNVTFDPVSYPPQNGFKYNLVISPSINIIDLQTTIEKTLLDTVQKADHVIAITNDVTIAKRNSLPSVQEFKQLSLIKKTVPSSILTTTKNVSASLIKFLWKTLKWFSTSAANSVVHPFDTADNLSDWLGKKFDLFSALNWHFGKQFVVYDMNLGQYKVESEVKDLPRMFAAGKQVMIMSAWPYSETVSGLQTNFKNMYYFGIKDRKAVIPGDISVIQKGVDETNPDFIIFIFAPKEREAMLRSIEAWRVSQWSGDISISDEPIDVTSSLVDLHQKTENRLLELERRQDYVLFDLELKRDLAETIKNLTSVVNLIRDLMKKQQTLDEESISRLNAAGSIYSQSENVLSRVNRVYVDVDQFSRVLAHDLNLREKVLFEINIEALWNYSDAEMLQIGDIQFKLIAMASTESGTEVAFIVSSTGGQFYKFAAYTNSTDLGFWSLATVFFPETPDVMATVLHHALQNYINIEKSQFMNPFLVTEGEIRRYSNSQELNYTMYYIQNHIYSFVWLVQSVYAKLYGNPSYPNMQEWLKNHAASLNALVTGSKSGNASLDDIDEAFLAILEQLVPSSNKKDRIGYWLPALYKKFSDGNYSISGFDDFTKEIINSKPLREVANPRIDVPEEFLSHPVYNGPAAFIGKSFSYLPAGDMYREFSRLAKDVTNNMGRKWFARRKLHHDWNIIGKYFAAQQRVNAAGGFEYVKGNSLKAVVTLCSVDISSVSKFHNGLDEQVYEAFYYQASIGNTSFSGTLSLYPKNCSLTPFGVMEDFCPIYPLVQKPLIYGKDPLAGMIPSFFDDSDTKLHLLRGIKSIFIAETQLDMLSEVIWVDALGLRSGIGRWFTAQRVRSKYAPEAKARLELEVATPSQIVPVVQRPRVPDNEGRLIKDLKQVDDYFKDVYFRSKIWAVKEAITHPDQGYVYYSFGSEPRITTDSREFENFKNEINSAVRPGLTNERLVHLWTNPPANAIPILLANNIFSKVYQSTEPQEVFRKLDAASIKGLKDLQLFPEMIAKLGAPMGIRINEKITALRAIARQKGDVGKDAPEIELLGHQVSPKMMADQPHKLFFIWDNLKKSRTCEGNCSKLVIEPSWSTKNYLTPIMALVRIDYQMGKFQKYKSFAIEPQRTPFFDDIYREITNLIRESRVKALFTPTIKATSIERNVPLNTIEVAIIFKDEVAESARMKITTSRHFIPFVVNGTRSRPVFDDIALFKRYFDAWIGLNSRESYLKNIDTIQENIDDLPKTQAGRVLPENFNKVYEESLAKLQEIIEKA